MKISNLNLGKIISQISDINNLELTKEDIENIAEKIFGDFDWNTICFNYTFDYYKALNRNGKILYLSDKIIK